MTTAVTYEDIITPLTLEKAKRSIVTVCKAVGVQSDTWGPTDEPHATLEFEAEQLVGLSTEVAEIGKLAVLRKTSGIGRTLVAKEWFGLTRNPAIQLAGSATLANSTASPITKQAGELLVVSSVDADLVYKNEAAVTVPAGGTAPVTLVAESPGAKYVVTGSTLLIGTPAPGLTISFAPGTSWITRVGADEETDAALLVRCETKQAGESPAGPTDAYTKWALDASAEVNRVRVVENVSAVYPDPAVRVYLATPAGIAPAGVVTTVDTYIQKKRPTGTLVATSSAAALVFDLLGTVGVAAGFLDAAKTKIATLLTRWFAGYAVSVNGEDVPGLEIGARVRVVQLIELIMSVPGVVYVDLLKPDNSRRVPHIDDFLPASGEVVALNNQLLYVAA